MGEHAKRVRDVVEAAARADAEILRLRCVLADIEAIASSLEEAKAVASAALTKPS